MSWIATYGDIEKINGRLRLYVDFTDGSIKVRREYDITDKDSVAIKQMIAEEVAKFERQDSLSDIKPGEVVEAPQEDVEKKAFLQDVQKLRKMNEAIVLGIKTDKDQDYIDQIQRVKSEYKEEYLFLL